MNFRRHCTLIVAALFALSLHAAAISGERPIDADHAMARNDDGHRVSPVREPHGPRRFPVAHTRGELAVVLGLTERDLAQRAPDGRLERRAAKIEVDIEPRSLAREVLFQLPSHGREALVEGMVKETMLGRAATLEDVGHTAAFAASDRARTMTAATINVSCGALVD